MADPKIEALSKIGVNVEEGLQYCRNNEMIYLKILKKYAEDAAGKIEEIRGYYENKDFENYGIQVHGLKSSSKTMGVMDVSELAKEQEFAAKEGNIDKVDAEHETLFSLYRETTQKILQALSGEAPKEDAVPSGEGMAQGELVGKLKELVNFLNTFEAAKAEEIVDELSSRSYGNASVTDSLKEVQSLIADFDMRTASQKVEDIISSLG